uniref:hypothetical protein n=1 Tax=Bartonella tribocorum TaxID=85701 RepID=UPI00155DAEE6|nr:hypothetical protein [Bartonella tribocorum]
MAKALFAAGRKKALPPYHDFGAVRERKNKPYWFWVKVAVRRPEGVALTPKNQRFVSSQKHGFEIMILVSAQRV